MNPFIDEQFYVYFENFPIKLVDVGASGGIKDTWKSLEKYIHLIGFEPDERAYEKLISSPKNNQTFFNIALHSNKEDIDLYLTRKQELASIFKPDLEILSQFPDVTRFDVLDQVTVKADTLDAILESHNIQDIDAVKIDTQGSGLSVLEGAEQTLKDVFCVELEAEFVPIYQSQQLFADIDTFMREQGFYLFDLRPWYWKREKGKQYGMPRGQLIFSDCLYLKSTTAIEEILTKENLDYEPKRKALRMMAICNLFGYLDYAIEIYGNHNYLFSEDEKLIFQNFVESRILWRTSGSAFLGNLEYINET